MSYYQRRLIHKLLGSEDVLTFLCDCVRLSVTPLCSFCSSGFSQSGMGGTMGSSLPPFQTTMSSSFGQTGINPAMDAQKSSGLFGMENKTSSNVSGSSPFNTTNPFSTSGPGIHSMDHSAGIREGLMSHWMVGKHAEKIKLSIWEAKTLKVGLGFCSRWMETGWSHRTGFQQQRAAFSICFHPPPVTPQLCSTAPCRKVKARRDAARCLFIINC